MPLHRNPQPHPYFILPGIMGKFLYSACLGWYVFKFTTLSMMNKSLWKFSDCKTNQHIILFCAWMCNAL